MNPASSSSSSSSSSADIYHQNPNWLSFSLSHHAASPSPSPPIPPFPLFHHPPSYPSTDEEPPPPPSVVPKLSDFLGGTPLAPHFPPPHVVNDPSPAVGPAYEPSDLKTIAASFLRGFSGDEQLDRPQELQMAGSDEGRQQQVGKKAVDSFGQRTSIYRGVTR